MAERLAGYADAAEAYEWEEKRTGLFGETLVVREPVGVVGAIGQAARSNRKNLITFDMGGTSTDVCLVVDGVPSVSSETEVDGMPIRTPVLGSSGKCGRWAA